MACQYHMEKRYYTWLSIDWLKSCTVRLVYGGHLGFYAIFQNAQGWEFDTPSIWNMQLLKIPNKPLYCLQLHIYKSSMPILVRYLIRNISEPHNGSHIGYCHNLTTKHKSDLINGCGMAISYGKSIIHGYTLIGQIVELCA